MNNIEFDAFLTSVLRLTRTMVIKIEAVALRDNVILQKAGYPVSSDKRTWRYYMNLNGDYHPTDEIMFVKSVDTGEEIVFNKANLNVHLQTFREYSSGGELFQRLSTTYPGQSELIRGILAPIPYTETIEADDYKILKYNENLVLWNEDQLIPQLQSWVNAETSHLFKNDYMITDNLMLPIAVMQLYADLIKAICTIRFEAIGTRYAHDFFIWSHIDSFGDFSKYKNSLTRFQIMWLYRNIAWVKNNPGQQYTFGKLLDNMLTSAEIPLAKYDMVETTETQLDELTPTPLYRRLQLNLIEDYGRAASFIDTQALILKQQYLAKDNYDQTSIYYEDALLKGKYSLHSELPTKTLVSSMTDYTNRHIDTLMSTVYNEWIYLAGKGLFRGKILVVDPKNGKSLRLPVGDAFYVWRYLIDLTKGKDPVTIEPAFYQNVMKIKPPTIDALIAIGGRAFIHEKTAQGIRDQWINVDTFIAPEYLMSYSAQVYDAKWNHRKIFSQYYDLNMRARVKNTTELMYESGYIEMTSYTAYKDLLGAYELDFSEYSVDEARNFAWDIFKRITGWDSNSQPSLRVKQNDLIEIMMRLSSYTINVVKEMDDGTEVTELKNETFVGDPKWTSEGNGSYGDFQNAKFDSNGHIDSIRHTETLVQLVDLAKPTFVMDSEGFGVIKSRDHIKPVDLTTDLRDYAVRINDTSYFRMLPLPDIPKPVEELPPPTYYGQLEFPEDLTPVEPWVDIPPTYYDKLVFPGDEVLPFTRVPNTQYGLLEIEQTQTTENDWTLLPGTDYSVLKTNT
jgi:hypothetical protein